MGEDASVVSREYSIEDRQGVSRRLEFGRESGRRFVLMAAVGLFVSSLMLSATSVSADQIAWIRQFPADFIAVDASGVYVAGMAGSTCEDGRAYPEDCDVFVGKYDADGNELWTRQFGSSADDGSWPKIGVFIAVDASGIYVAGGTLGAFPGQTNAGSVDVFVRAYDPDGNELWTRQFGSSRGDSVYAMAVHTSGVYLAGDTYGGGFVRNDGGFVRRYDRNGNEIWTRGGVGTTLSPAGENALAVDASGVYVAGYICCGFRGKIVADGFVRRYDFRGREIWTRQFGGDSPFAEAEGVAVDASGVYVAAWISPLGAAVLKYDLKGNEVWTQRLNIDITDMTVDASGLYVAGSATVAKLTK